MRTLIGCMHIYPEAAEECISTLNDPLIHEYVVISAQAFASNAAFKYCGYNLLMEDLQTSETVSMPRLNLEPFIHVL